MCSCYGEVLEAAAAVGVVVCSLWQTTTTSDIMSTTANKYVYLMNSCTAYNKPIYGYILSITFHWTLLSFSLGVYVTYYYFMRENVLLLCTHTWYWYSYCVPLTKAHCTNSVLYMQFRWHYERHWKSTEINANDIKVSKWWPCVCVPKKLTAKLKMHSLAFNDMYHDSIWLFVCNFQQISIPWEFIFWSSIWFNKEKNWMRFKAIVAVTFQFHCEI